MALGSSIVLNMDWNSVFGRKFMIDIKIIALASIWWPPYGFGLTNYGLEFNFWLRIYETKS